MDTPIIPLAVVSPGNKVRIVSIVGGRGVREHLFDMGLDVGMEVEVLKAGAPGPFLIAIKETRLAIGQGAAQKIMVSSGMISAQ
jgi:Fe2+ transport system protein FeoA